MGIYTNGKIYGIQIYNFSEDDVINILFEKKYNDVASDEQMKEAYLFYTGLNDKNNILFKIYTKCSSTLDNYNNNDHFMMWYPFPFSTFLAKFCILNGKV
jgi:hypothetical protein